jgi:aspartate-semialdehyde dehydrogenase
MNKLRVGILGATGMVGQRFVTLLNDHPWFEVTALAASPRSAGKPYREAVIDRWLMKESIPTAIADLTVVEVEKDREEIVKHVDFVFSALDLEKEEIVQLEESYAASGIPVVSNNSAHRWTPDVPMIMPELNAHHTDIIPMQKKNRGWQKGFIAVKPNCSLQSYLPLVHALTAFHPLKVEVMTLQAISGAGKTFEMWPEMVDNVIPYIGGEEEKTEEEPMKILGRIEGNKIISATEPAISATCIRVAASNGHMAAVSVLFEKKPTADEILQAWRNFQNPLTDLHLPSAPDPFITYFEEDNRPQTRLDRDVGCGMGIAAGRLRPDPVLHWKFIGLSHNTIRGAAGGASRVAELLKVKGYLN